jgi:aminoglycoside phosphotransferase (APT) family kinase protein
MIGGDMDDTTASATAPGQGDQPTGVDVPKVTRWFAEHLPQFTAPFHWTLLAGGHSNLTYRVTDADGATVVLRRPPLGHVLASAHDMSREYRAIAALGPVGIPVPPALGLCTDLDVNGAPFYVMGLVPGVVLHTLDICLKELPEHLRRTTGESMFDVLADLHAVDVDAVGLDVHGPKEGYCQRQINRWYKQYTAMKYREIPDVDACFERLSAKIPVQQRVSVAHGDYRLGNCITSPVDGTIKAILDWEISTLGDPIADLGYLVSTWARTKGEPGNGDVSVSPTMAPGFPDVDELVARYAARSGLDVSELPWYVAFNAWKGACIVQGVVARYRGGALGDTTHVDLEGFDRSVVDRSRYAMEILDTIK